MPTPKDVYVNCDVLENLPKPNRENWLCEIELLRNQFPQNAKVLQVGSMDGTRIIHLLKARPDLDITGLEVERSLVNIAKRKIAAAGLGANFVCGDITNSPHLPRFDYVICLNNTLGYISEEERAIAEMRKLGKAAIISVYGEKFTDALARKYFTSLNLTTDRIEKDRFMLREFTSVKRYARKEVESWNAKITETPLGYFCVLAGSKN